MRGTIIRALLLSLLFSALGLAWVIFRVGSVSDLLTIRRLPAVSLGLAIAALLVSFLFSAWRLQYLASRLKQPLKLHHAVRTHILGAFSAAVTPGGSGNTPAMALLLMHQGFSGGQAWATAVATFAADAFFHAWSMPLALIILLLLGIYPRSALALGVGVLAILITVAVGYLLFFKLVWLTPIARLLLRGPLLRLRRRGLRFIERLLEANHAFASASWRWHLPLQTLSALAWISFFAVLFFLAKGLGIHLGLLAAEAGVMVVTVLSTMIPTPGGSGFFEVGLSYLLLGHGNNNAVPAVILLYRLLSYYSLFLIGPLLGGYVLLKRLQASREKAPAGKTTT
jgi:uncharacterized protein (TIRG00374 family)